MRGRAAVLVQAQQHLPAWKRCRCAIFPAKQVLLPAPSAAADSRPEPATGASPEQPSHQLSSGQKDERVQQPQQPTTQPAEQEQLWWVEKFEARRQQLEQQQQAGSTTKTVAANAPPKAAEAAASSPQAPIPWPRLALQLLQLTVAVAALILWPASLYRTGLYSSKVWLLFLTYCLFFGGGTVWRMVQFGPLASRNKDKQAKSMGTRAAWLLFVAMMPVLHWGCIGSYMKARAAAAAAAAAAALQQGAGEWVPPGLLSSLALYDVLGLALLAGAVALNWVAARHLGRAYDRVVQPESLVTTGPYAWVQHPIYTSYIMLFTGYAMMLHSLGYALLAVAVCLIYYKSRVALEAQVLQQAFGERYQQYNSRTKLFVPFLV